MRFPIGGAVLLALLLGACGGSGGGASSDVYGLESRVTPSGVQIPTEDGVDDNTDLKAVDAFPGLTFPEPTYLTHAGDGSGRLFVTQRIGKISVINDIGVGRPRVSTFLDISTRVDSRTPEVGLLGVTFDPAFEDNGYFYVYYLTVTTAGTRKSRVSRFRTSSSDSNVADPASERVMLEVDQPYEYHFGGWMDFGPDGMFYISTGDGGLGFESQDTASSRGKILRVQVNADGGYSIPPDNPFGNATWAYGFRNPWRCGFDRVTGLLWCGDVGQLAREEINVVKRGGNYGWNQYEGSKRNLDAARPFSEFQPPLHEYDRSTGLSVIGGYVYRGSALPNLVGRYLYTDLGSSSLWAIETRSDGGISSFSVVANGLDTVVSFGEDEAGEIYALSFSGVVSRFERASGATTTASMPATLSATGLFTDLVNLNAAPGVIDYEVNSPLWSDGADKRRWLLLPGNETIGFSAGDAWSFPVGTITVKHFQLPVAGGGATRVETRVMVHRPSGWSGYTYRWRPDQSDADLMVGSGRAFYDTVDSLTGRARRVAWSFPSRSQCMNCHTQAAGRVLGLNTLQFNRGHAYERSGRSDNQLRAFNHVGMFSQDIGDAGQYAAMPDPADATATLENRAKSYLAVNCSVCHRPGGPATVDIDFRYATPVAEMNLVREPARSPLTPGSLLVKPGSPAESDLWRRVSANDETRMPPLATTISDERAVKLLSDWITGLQ